MIYSLYSLSSPEDGRVRYIGITQRSLEKRLNGHISEARNNPNKNKRKSEWINRLLDKGVRPTILLLASFDNLLYASQQEIDLISEFGLDNLLNKSPGGESPKQVSDNTRLILSIVGKGKAKSAKHKARIAAAMVGNKRAEGHKKTEAERKFISKRFSKPIISISDDGRVIEYPSISYAALITGGSRSSISQCLAGKFKKSNKLQWKYKH